MQAKVLVIEGVVDAHSRVWECADGEVPAECWEDTAGTVGEKAYPIAAEIVLVGTADAGKERVAVVELPSEAGHRECKRNIHVVGFDI